VVASFLFLCHIKKVAPSSADPTSIPLLHEGKNRTFPSPVFFFLFSKNIQRNYFRVRVHVKTQDYPLVYKIGEENRDLRGWPAGPVARPSSSYQNFEFFFLLFTTFPHFSLGRKKDEHFFSSGLVIVLVVGIYIRNPV
jgi:hypothetical protein